MTVEQRYQIFALVQRGSTQKQIANPYSSWERGLNEYTNKLIRQYIPKGTDFNNVSNKEVKQIQYKLNRRPRKKLNYKTPAQLFFASLENKIAFAS